MTDANMQELVEAAAKAYIYGYPLVYNLNEATAYLRGTKFSFKAPLNTFGYARELAGPETKFVSPNNDTLYLIAVCDVSRGPLVLHVPDTAGRYYVLQFVDAWTNNFAYVGRRATGTDQARFLLTGSAYSGDVPDGMQVVKSPTDIFIIVGRLQVNGAADAPAVHALQDQFMLESLSGVTAVEKFPQPDARVSADLEWWEKFRVLLAAYPPPAADAPFLTLCEKLGLTAAESPFVTPDATMAQVLVAGQKAGQEKIDEIAKGGGGKPVNGWTSALHLFDYNLDSFSLGTIDSPEWKIADRAVAYVTRAVAARAGLWGNHGYEADYLFAWVDADGNTLMGDQKYTLRLDPLPPVDAFWSLTMYNVPDFYLVANSADRYSIGDRTPGLKSDEDGSVTIYMQKESPGADKESNWLPTPDGAFRPILRAYAPQPPLLEGTYVLPAIQKVG
jgi:hypothetical protein